MATTNKQSCLDEEAALRFAANDLAASQMAQIREHLTYCELCSDLVACAAGEETAYDDTTASGKQDPLELAPTMRGKPAGSAASPPAWAMRSVWTRWMEPRGGFTTRNSMPAAVSCGL